jgi:hypothetical protein
LLGFLLASSRQLFELVLANFHVRPYYGKSNRVHGLIPVGSLLGLVESFHDDRVSFRHV